MRSVILKSTIFAVLLLFINNALFAAVKKAPPRTIHIAGLVVNAKTLMPVEAANIFDAEDHLLATTDKNGYYNVTINVTPTGEMYFSIKIKKEGYQAINQNEHWGNLSDGTKALYYFGLKQKGDKTSSFSKLNNKFDGDLSYASAESNFAKAKAERLFDIKIEDAKAGNQDVLIQIDGAYYIVDDTGWIKLNSDKDLISIDKKQVVAADQLNSILKRKNVKGMTPTSSSSAKFTVYTR